MTQVTSTINDLITQAYYMVNEYQRENPLPGFAMNEGLYLLNQLVAQFSSADSYIPSQTLFEFTMIPGQDVYTFSNIIPADFNTNRIANIDFLNFFIDAGLNRINVPITIVSPAQMYYNNRQEVANAWPQYATFTNYPLNSEIRLFPAPALPYLAQLRGKFFIDKFELFQPIENVPLYWQRFLIYALARERTNYYIPANWTPTAEAEYQRMFNDLMNSGQKDMTIHGSSLIRYPYGYWYGPYNLFGTTV